MYYHQRRRRTWPRLNASKATTRKLRLPLLNPTPCKIRKLHFVFAPFAFFFAHRAFAALLALSLRCFFVSLAARALPPCFPLSRKNCIISVIDPNALGFF